MRSLRSAIVILGCSVVLLRHPSVCHSEESTAAPKATKITTEKIGEVEAVRGAESRIGGTDRIFLIEDDWELNRCTQLLPKLPQIDTAKECLLVVMSWPKRPRAMKSIEVEADTLVVKLDQPPSAMVETADYRAPKFLVFKLPAWRGPVRVEINGEPSFTIPRGEDLVKRSHEVWEEILRLHSGGRPTLPQQVRRHKRIWHDMTDDEIKLHIMENKEKFWREDPVPYYDLLFQDLIDMRAKPIVPRIFALIESMGKHDKASIPATEALVGIGGPEVIEQAKIAMKSWNPRARATAMRIMAEFALPEMRGMAREKIAELDRSAAFHSMKILLRLGITKDDVPHLIHALEQVEKYYSVDPSERPKLENGYSGEIGRSLIYQLGELGPDAAEALPILERFTTDPRLPLLAFQKNAQEAIDKIKQGKKASKSN